MGVRSSGDLAGIPFSSVLSIGGGQESSIDFFPAHPVILLCLHLRQKTKPPFPRQKPGKRRRRAASCFETESAAARLFEDQRH